MAVPHNDQDAWNKLSPTAKFFWNVAKVLILGFVAYVFFK